MLHIYLALLLPCSYMKLAKLHENTVLTMTLISPQALATSTLALAPVFFFWVVTTSRARGISCLATSKVEVDIFVVLKRIDDYLGSFLKSRNELQRFSPPGRMSGGPSGWGEHTTGS